MMVSTEGQIVSRILVELKPDLEPGRVPDEFLAPSTDWENRTAEELIRLPKYRVHHIPNEECRALGMREGYCHDNAATFSQMSPGTRRGMVGWSLRVDAIFLHSLVIEDGRLVCPSPRPAPDMIFIADPWVGADFRPGAPAPYYRKGIWFDRSFVRIPIRYDRPSYMLADHPCDAPEIASWIELPDRVPGGKRA